MTQTLSEYAQEKRDGAGKRKIPVKIRERWQTRIVARGLHEMGRTGAVQYLSDYGKNIGAKKVIALARVAEAEGCPDMALGFWIKAYSLEHGCMPPDDDAGSSQAMEFVPGLSEESPHVDGLPSHLQPGKIVTMQPVDTDLSREELINDPAFWAQPKRDGRKLVIIATPTDVYYQARNLNLQPSPLAEIHAALLDVAQALGTFVIETELWYRDVLGGEHRTGSQAATANISAGFENVHPCPKVSIFKVLFANGVDLTSHTEAARISTSEKHVGLELFYTNPGYFEVLKTARTVEEKRALVDKQSSEEREGEVWVRRDCIYTAGKQKGKAPPYLRTKYLMELDVVVTELTPTTAEGRPFGAIRVSIYKDDVLTPLGSVGTRFNRDEMSELVKRCSGYDPVTIKIITQGLTETGKLMHGRFDGFSEKLPEQCEL